MSFVAFLLAVAAAGTPSAGSPRPAPRWAVAVLPAGAEFSLEVASDPESRARGYMGRSSVGPHEGMLFVFETDDRYGFWMKNCLVPLDMVWLDETLRVVDIARSQRPCPAEGECPERVPSAPARYVLEFAAGTADAQRLRRGDRIVILSEPPIP